MITQPPLIARLRASTAACALLSMLAVTPSLAVADEAEQMLPDMVVRDSASPLEKYKLPNTTVGVTAERLADTVNVMDTEDAVKYMPSLGVRKRNNGDTQSILMTRTWGYSSSARTLVFADDVLISALIANDNSRGGPRWGMVAPEEIERVDMVYGPFAAQHPGNAMGGVLQIATRMPDKLEASFKQTESLQPFSLYNTRDLYRTDQTSATIGNRLGNFSFFLSGNTAHSQSQPLTMITNGSSTTPTGAVSGTIVAKNKSGAPANVVGVGGLLQTEMDTLKAKMAYDFTPELRAAYTFGFWQNNGRSRVESYLKDSNGVSTLGNVSGFASSNYKLEQAQTSHALSLKSDTKGFWDFDAVATHVQYDHDRQAAPSTVVGNTFSDRGQSTHMDGTNWSTVDLKGIWRPEGKGGDHEVSFGAHYDRYILVATVYGLRNWNSENNVTGKLSDGRGNTQTSAGWVQESWAFAPGFRATLGGRYESWTAFDGYNATTNGLSSIQPGRDATAFSPKGSLSWEFVPQWSVTGSVGRATRFPTVSELYFVAGSGTSQVIPNSVLRPERETSYELALEGGVGDGKVRLSFFQEDVAKAIIAQNSFLNGVSTSYNQNVDQIRNRGFELAAEQRNLVFDGFDLQGSFTYLDAKIIRDPTWSGGTQVVGKRVPNIPDMKATMVATYRPTEEWALTGAARYQGKMTTTLDNTDYVGHVYGAFDRFFVMDVRARYKHNENLEGAIGIDNVNNAKYWEYHPFPQRTFIAEMKMKL
ncbi:TonB-dependent receptor [Paramagnetospirillum kuznetsovii]|uniref:TonB-dependent receptor n=1 Tax=Paramagnetospirillum kuznetsovii TaxID=2053833 RepID=A0A364NZ92_9PROT|nr:TonB-dependent receptor [Paramagnetospirillum kuznetsovii]RAU22398.1 TonB-dependent receptor [Paramagnetospirillum kuznetsovii]